MIPALPRRAALLGAPLLGALRPAVAAEPSNAELVQRANAGTVGVISGGIDGTYARIAADLAAVLDDGGQLRVLPILGKGSLQNIRDVLLLRGVDIGIVQSDALAYARRQKLLPGVETQIQYIAKLYDEELHLLARPGIERVQDLAGAAVNVDVAGSGTAMTAAQVFESLGIAIRTVNGTQDLALERLKRGEIAAMAYVAGKPARIFAGLPRESGLRFLAMPATDAFLETYLPGRLTAADYPTLVEEGAPVETLAVGAAMAVFAWAPGTERFGKVARFVEALQRNFATFQQPPRHPKWREVNLAAQLPGWTRFDPAAQPPPRPRRRREWRYEYRYDEL